MASNIPVIVQGNSFSLAIPLQIYYINGDQMDLEDYTPDPTDDVTVQLKGSRRNYTYTPTIDGNVANIDLTGNELADNYSVVVSIVKDNGQRLRSFRTDQFFIVESSDDLTTDDIIQGLEENVIYLNSSIFIAGADGRGIEGIQKTGTSGLVDTYTITYSDNTTSTFNVTNGAQGEQGVGIATIAKTSTSGKTDTYTITLTSGQTSTFEVTNGLDGVDLGLANIIDDLITGGSTNVLSAGMGKLIKENVQTILNALGEYAFPNGKPEISWGGDTPTPTIYDSEVEYLQSSGTQVINSGVGGNLETDITIKFQTLSTIGVAVLGSRGTNTESIQIYAANNGTQRFGSGSAMVSFSANTDYTVTFNKTKITVNGTNYIINTSTSFTTPTNIFFFGTNSAKGSFKISSVQITQNGTLVRDFIPVRVGQVGYMYDNVTQQLYANAGTGDFILGNDKNA